jgi:hypothetical protein
LSREQVREFCEAKAFSRERKISASDLVYQCLALSLEGSEFGQEIVAKNLFACDLNRSSLCRAKAKLTAELFQALLIKRSTTLKKKTKWRGHSVRAVDGTYLTLPSSKDILKDFPRRRSDGHYPKALLVTVVDVFSGEPICAHIGCSRSSERKHLLELKENLNPGDIVLMDRGFFAYDLWHNLVQKGQHFICRSPELAKQKCSLYRRLLDSKKKELIVDLCTRSGLNLHLQYV